MASSSSNYLEIPNNKKQQEIAGSLDDDDHSFIILSSSGAASLSSYERDAEFINHNPTIQFDDSDVETMINSELDDKTNDFNSIPEICRSLIETIQPGAKITAEDDYSNTLKGSLEDIITNFNKFKDSATIKMKFQQKCLLLIVTFVTFTYINAMPSSYDTNTSYCPAGCACNLTLKHAKCSTLAGLIRFNGTSNFESLDLSNNSLRKITSHLDKFTSLQKLDLSGNRLSEVNKLPKGIEDLNLSGNRITSAKLSKIPKSVVNLNLTDNHITYVPHSIMTLKYLRRLELSGNPINCTCDTLAVRNWLKAQHVWSDRHITCMAPLKFKGRPWLQMKQAEVCEVKVATKKSISTGSKYNWDEIEKNDNELMQRDGYAEGSGGAGDDDTILDPEDYDYDKEDEASNEPIKPEVDEEEPEKQDPVIDEEKEDSVIDEVDNKQDVDEEKEDPVVDEVDSKPETDEEKKDPVIDEVENEHLIPVKSEPSTTEATHPSSDSPNVQEYDDEDEDYEGSGSSADNIPLIGVSIEQSTTEASTTEPSSTSVSAVSEPVETTDDDDDYADDTEGSGSDISVLTPLQSSSTTESDITFEPETTEATFEVSEAMDEDAEQSTLPDLNIFDEKLGMSSTTEEPTSDDGAVVRAGLDVDSDTERVEVLEEGSTDQEKANVMQAKSDDSKNTFILLGVLGALLIGLIVYVAIKDKSGKRNRRNNKSDVETGPGREMKEMNKDLLGKEKGKNGHHPHNNHNSTIPEKSPLIHSNSNSEKPQNGHSFPAVSPNNIDTDDAPLNNSSPMSTFKPIKEPVNENVHDEPNNNNPQNGDIPEVHAPNTTQQPEPVVNTPKRYSPVYTPRTPKLGNNQHLSDPKYSPVYSPETGRVKIKATEMPRPKTPVLVTRTKSSAGDYITTTEERHEYCNSYLPIFYLKTRFKYKKKKKNKIKIKFSQIR
uniref:CSON014770 protein n=1 Tax=Culicoides sonorensis TaxID=179676 RepID=A0A336LNW9_CULSO